MIDFLIHVAVAVIPMFALSLYSMFDVGRYLLFQMVWPAWCIAVFCHWIFT